MGKFQVIVITAPEGVHYECGAVEELLDSGAVDFVHVRKPAWSGGEVEELIRQIDSRFHPRLRLHDHFGLAEKYGLGGVQLNSRSLTVPESVKSVTRSLHFGDNLEEASRYEYVTLSPVYDSISKEGYTSRFSPDSATLKGIKGVGNVIAMGGVTPENFRELYDFGFAGAALLGYVWNGHRAGNLGEVIYNIKKNKELCYSL